jgi:glycerol-3-phosphate cytidylyltransferase-like family protein
MNYPLQKSSDFWKSLKGKLLEAMPELLEDPECLIDTLEGLTDTKEQLAALLRSAVMDEALVVGLSDLQNRLADRKACLVERAQRKRKIALNYMTDLGFHDIKAPDLTASIRTVPPSVVIINENLIPDKFMVIKKQPNKTLIKVELKAGHDVPGCQLSNGSETLAIKV